jgi:hypothetical protein
VRDEDVYEIEQEADRRGQENVKKNAEVPSEEREAIETAEATEETPLVKENEQKEVQVEVIPRTRSRRKTQTDQANGKDDNANNQGQEDDNANNQGQDRR